MGMLRLVIQLLIYLQMLKKGAVRNLEQKKIENIFFLRLYTKVRLFFLSKHYLIF